MPGIGEFFGRALNVLQAIGAAQSPGGLQRFLTNQTLLRQDPRIRSGLVGQPMEAAQLLGVGSQEVPPQPSFPLGSVTQPEKFGPGLQRFLGSRGFDPNLTAGTSIPNLPPLAPQQQAAQLKALIGLPTLRTATGPAGPEREQALVSLGQGSQAGVLQGLAQLQQNAPPGFQGTLSQTGAGGFRASSQVAPQGEFATLEDAEQARNFRDEQLRGTNSKSIILSRGDGSYSLGSATIDRTGQRPTVAGRFFSPDPRGRAGAERQAQWLLSQGKAAQIRQSVSGGQPVLEVISSAIDPREEDAARRRALADDKLQAFALAIGDGGDFSPAVQRQFFGLAQAAGLTTDPNTGRDDPNFPLQFAGPSGFFGGVATFDLAKYEAFLTAQSQRTPEAQDFEILSVEPKIDRSPTAALPALR